MAFRDIGDSSTFRGHIRDLYVYVPSRKNRSTNLNGLSSRSLFEGIMPLQPAATTTSFLRCCRNCYLVAWLIVKLLLGLAGWPALFEKIVFSHWTVVCSQLAWRTDCCARWIQFELLAGCKAVRALASSTWNLGSGNLFFLTKNWALKRIY